ncbi:MerR family transcriptional regulator [Paenibacillus sp. VCA1]|uniref:MerR family transcriptional regulator n=1 Tax=Paenibacillus sp. VCA1 TaxID=3039148 RepID=UPI002871DC05|nr:MerR family transcriptional regulator [Paenibacillus sp. VCA1]MDR9855049.1 MerR family transcriptional regulator [Paenibacillus sp. VCA1]
MYTIRQAAEVTGFSPDTLRYYEKIGLLNSPSRGPGDVRQYSDDDVKQLTSIHCLKKTGLSLEDLKEFIQNGECYKSSSNVLTDEDLRKILSRRDILSKHLENMERQYQELKTIIDRTKANLEYYNEILNEEPKTVMEKESFK